MKFIHTADWQLGKPFARVGDPYKRSIVQRARVEAVKRLGALAKDEGAEFVLVAGDLFDSTSVSKATVSAACAAIGTIGLPVLAIPGNHDHAGPGSVWDQEFFLREREALAPNLRVLVEAEPIEVASAVILPCPLVRRTVMGDPTEWLRSAAVYEGLPADKARVVLAHGSTQSFSGKWEDDEEDGSATNLLDLSRLPESEVDYVALGDWHGTKQIGAKAWYAGTPEPDRFPKGGDHDVGNVLVVESERGTAPRVTARRVGGLTWSELSFDIAGDTALGELENRLGTLVGQRAEEDLLRLTLQGSLGLEAAERLRHILEALEARLLRLKLVDRTIAAPTEDEIQTLTQGGANPLIARVAAQLVQQTTGDGEDAAVARIALRELYAAYTRARTA
jgi:DNA repair exonuclease SbcCD nuclease subunit